MTLLLKLKELGDIRTRDRIFQSATSNCRWCLILKTHLSVSLLQTVFSQMKLTPFSRTSTALKIKSSLKSEYARHHPWLSLII